MNEQLQISDFEAVIFDMDGVLIDSEPVWKIAMGEVFHAVGCPLTVKDFQHTVGLRIDEVIAFWYKHSPWENVSILKKSRTKDRLSHFFLFGVN